MMSITFKLKSRIFAYASSSVLADSAGGSVSSYSSSRGGLRAWAIPRLGSKTVRVVVMSGPRSLLAAAFSSFIDLASSNIFCTTVLSIFYIIC